MAQFGLLIFIIVAISPHMTLAQDGADTTLVLWPKGAPDSKGNTELDKSTLTIFLPEETEATGTGVVVFPGGGYSHLAMEKEGYKVANWFNKRGVAAFVVKYRLGKRYQHPSQLQDAQRAIRMVKNKSEEWNVDPGKLGIMGFSAGGHLASTAGTHFEQSNSDADDEISRLSSRPDFMILIYPVITMQMDYTHQGSRNHLLGDNPESDLVTYLSNELQVTDQTPPTFIIHSSNDTVVPVENSLQFYKSLRDYNVSAEMHVFEDGPHGFGLAEDFPQLSGWPDLLHTWLIHRNLLH